MSKTEPMMFAGLRCFEIPEAVEVKRSLKERLFSWPWKPKQKTKWVDNPACPPYGQVIRQGNTAIYASSRTLAEIKRQATQ